VFLPKGLARSVAVRETARYGFFGRSGVEVDTEFGHGIGLFLPKGLARSVKRPAMTSSGVQSGHGIWTRYRPFWTRNSPKLGVTGTNKIWSNRLELNDMQVR